MKPELVTLASVAHLEAGSTLNVRSPFIVTPSAAEHAHAHGITIQGQTKSHSHAVLQSGDTPGPLEAIPLAQRIDSTLLSTEATPAQITTMCRRAVELNVRAVCINPIFVELAVSTIAGRGPHVATVCGFPLGASTSAIKAAEARLAEAQGAQEFDMVLSVGQLKSGHVSCVHRSILNVRNALKNADSILKVIIEAPLLSDEEKVTASIICIEAGADFVKTCTGFRGPATVEDVALIRQTVGNRAQVKAAGGIRDRQTAMRMIEAGADRIGTSQAVDVLKGP